MFYVIHNNAAHTCQRRRGTMANTSCWNQSVVNTMLNIHNLNESRIYIRAGCMCTHCMRSYCWQRPQVEGRQEHEIRGRERERELPSFGIGESLGLNFTKKKCQARQKLTRKSKLSTGGVVKDVDTGRPELEPLSYTRGLRTYRKYQQKHN